MPRRPHRSTGRPAGRPSLAEDEPTLRVSLNVPATLHAELVRLAERRACPLSELVRDLLYRAVVLEKPE